MFDIIAWVNSEMHSRITSGKSATEAEEEILALVFEHGYQDDLVRVAGKRMIAMLFTDYLRENRRSATNKGYVPPNVIPATNNSPAAVKAALVTLPAAPINYLASSSSIYFALIDVDGEKVMVGDMQHDDWLSKSQDYKLRSKNASRRADFCATMASRVPTGSKTRDVLTEDEIKTLWPDIGL